MRKLLYLFMVLCVSFQMKAQTVVDIVVGSPDHTTLEAAVIAAELADDLSGPGPFTLFAPTDAAFAALPAGTVDALLQDPTGELASILLYHVLGLQALSTDLVDGMMVTTLQGEEIMVTINGSGVFINDAQVTVADISATNGVVHVIDAVLLPPVMPTNTIMDIVSNSAVHNTLEAALVASGLDETLATPGDFTLFAPTDAAFDLLPAGTVETLLADPTGQLVDVLLYHVLSGTIPSSFLVDGMMAMTAQGSDVTVTINANGVFINDAQVIVADIMADNGVVHVIDAVLLPPAQTSTVVDIIVNSPDHTTLEAAVVAAGLVETLSGTGPFTVFAPTDAAFAALPAGTVEALLADPSGALTQILLYHVVGATALSTDLSDGQVIATLNGADVIVTINGGVFINNAQVIVADIVADNGVVHVIDAVLLPPPAVEGCTATEACNFNSEATIDDASCVFPGEPCDDTNDLTFNDVLGADCVCAGQTEGCTDMVACNYDANAGIDNGSCLFTGDNCDDNNAATVNDVYTVDCGCEGVVPSNTVVDIIVNSPDHNTLETAVIAAGLAGTLSGTGPFTVFAPTDAAFAALPAGTVDALLADPTGALTQILLYHVVGASALSTDLSDGQVIATLNGADVIVTINGGVFINNAQVIVADIVADNGVVHVIDAVLLPPAEPTNTILDIVVNSDVHNTLEAAVVAAGLQGALAGPGPLTLFAPTDAAFAALPAGTVDALLADPTGALTQILLYHVVGASALSTDLSDGQVIATLNGADVIVTINGGVFINNAQVIVADIVADNGVVHVIDAVLLPSADVEGCTATEACNYNSAATIDDASCVFPGEPCDDANDLTFNDVLGGDCVCAGQTEGCTDMVACNYDATAGLDNGTCVFAGDNCDDNNPATVNDVYTVDCGCEGVVPSNTVVDIIVNSPDHNTLETAVVAAGLAGTLSGTGPFTVFAPTDAAFAALPAGTVDALLADPTGALTQILLYHVVGASALSTDLSDGQVIATLNGADVTVTINGGVFINNAQVIVADIIADNGVVHVIDAVLLPPPPAIEGCTAIEACNYNAAAEVEDGSCVFPGEPCDDMNANTTNDVLGNDCACVGELLGCTEMTACNYDMNAVVDNGSCQFPGDNCDDGDVATINDVFTADCGCAGIISNNTVVDIIVNSPDHTTLETAVIAAGLQGALSATGPFTVFAPTDAAFAALPAGVLDAVLADPNGLLTQILLYHVVSGTALSTDLTDGMVVATLNGASVTVTIAGSNVIINDALVTVADILADNGVVHVINAVLLPPAPQVEGCTAVEACNYNAEATIEDGSCILPGEPCDDMNENTINDVLNADCVCAGDMLGCTDMTACNYDMNAMVDNGSCQFPGDNCDDNNSATINDVYGIDCTCAGTIVTNTVVDIIVNSADHNTLEAAVIAAGLADDLSGVGPFTVFAPTDAAFAALPAGVIDALLADPTGALADVLLYHVVGGLALSTDLSDGQMIATLLGEDITVMIDMNGVFINDAQVIVADVLADNGVVHVIDAVLLPPPPQPTNTILDIVVNSADHNTLEAAVVAAGLQTALSGTGPLTVFAPTDAAFAALPAGTLDALLADPTGALTQVLLYHAVAGAALSTDLADGMMITTIQGQDVTVTINANGVFINDAQVIVADIIADNGVVHVIDAVLIPELNPEPTTVVDIIVNSAVHTTLEAAVIAAELADDLSGDGPFTVFAPTDAAFAALPAGVLDGLLADPTGALAQVLLYHVVSGEALSNSLTNGQTITTLQGQDVTVSITGGNVFINNAQVIMADITADNGVVHVIDAVLTPSTSVNEVTMNSVVVYPNPAAEQLTISMPSMNGSTVYSIYSITGELITTGNLYSTTTTVSTDALAQGMYQLKVVNGNDCVTRSFMKK